MIYDIGSKEAGAPAPVLLRTSLKTAFLASRFSLPIATKTSGPSNVDGRLRRHPLMKSCRTAGDHNTRRAKSSAAEEHV